MKGLGVIMAGGGGTRFWPLSRQKTPKQLLNLTGKDLMVNEAVHRLSYTIKEEDIFIVTNKVQAEAMREATRGSVVPDHILIEPAARNTAACIGYAAMEIVSRYGDGIMVVTPSDSYIKDEAAFTRILSSAVSAVEKHDKLVTIGITPAFPATGYGYIRFDKAGDTEEKTVTEFKEKPDQETARRYIESREYVWNSGMFVWKASTVLKMFSHYAPDIYEKLNIIRESLRTTEEKKTIEDIYPEIRNISIDYAIMEPAAADGQVLVIPGEFGWNDVGSWDMMGVLHEADDRENVFLGNVISVDARNNIVYSQDRLTAMIGVEDLIVVDTADVMMICRKDRAQDVKQAVEKLKQLGYTQYL